MTKSPWPLAGGNLRCALFFALTLVASAAQAQWSWRDANGEVTFSDSPPPPEVMRSDILHQPTGGVSISTTGSEPAPATAVAPAAAPAGAPHPGSPPKIEAPATAPPPGAQRPSKPDAGPKTLAEQDADFRKRLAEQQKAEQKQAEDEAQAAQRAEACNQAKSYLQVLQSGARLMRPDASGERNFLDDDQRAAEVQKTQEAVDKNC